MTKFLYTLVFTLCVLCMNAQTLWTGAVSNDWNDAANWTAGIPKSGQTATLPIMENGNSPTYGGSPVIDFTIQNAGTLTFNTVVFNNGTIINFGGGVIENNNYFINAGAMVFDNDGIFNNSGVFDNFGAYEHAASAELNNLGTFNSYGDLNSNGPILNEGTMVVSGTLVTTQKMENNGRFEVNGLVDFPIGSELINSTDARVVVGSGAMLQINSSLTSSGVILNNGSFAVQSASVLENTGTVRNNASLELSGKIMNQGTMINSDGIMIKSGGQLENRDNVNNQGEITMEICAMLIQDSDRNISGSIQTDGLTYEISGSVNETNLEFGETFTDLSSTPSPQPACKSDNFFFLDESGVVEFTAADIDRGRSYAACGAELADITVSPTSFTAADAGVRIVTITVTDNLGNTNSCDDFVTIIPFSEPITASNSAAIDSDCGEDVLASTLPGANFAEVSFPTPTATSACSGMPLTTLDCSSVPAQINGLTFIGEQNGSKYYSSNTDDLTWHEARDLAINLGGHLATVNDAAENEFIRNNIQTDFAWIGYNDEAQEGNFLWISGASNYENWNSGEPNNSNGTEHFARILKSSGKWTDRNELFQAEAVIEIPCPVVMENSCAVAPEVDGMMYLGTFDNSHYYKKPDGDLRYESAKAFVESRGGNLPVISSEAEDNFLRNAAGNGSYWLGLTDEDQEGSFEWATGAPVSYTNWNTSEPNDYGTGEDYTQVRSDGRWNDIKASNLNWAIMEIPCQTNTGSTICSLDNYGTEGISDRLIWMRPDGEEAQLFETVGENTFQEFSDGTALLSGRVQSQENSDRRYSYSVKLGNKRTHAEWTSLGRLVKEANTPLGDPTTWSFYEVVEGESTFTGEGAFSGQTLNISNNPADFTYGFQIGFGANLKDGSFGISGWWAFSGSGTGRGDFNGDLNNCQILPGGNGEATVTQIQGIQSGDNFPVGTTQIAYRITDDCGNEEICLFDVVVEATPSELTLTNCSGDIVVDAPICAEGTNVSWDLPTATTTCFIDDIIVDRVDDNPSSGDFFPIGTTTISYIVADSCGNAEVCVFNIIVNEVEGELSVNCVEDFTVTADRDATAAIINFAAPTGTTTGSGVTVRQLDGPETGTSLEIGTYPVIFLISDDCNNTELCIFNVTVEPTVIDDDNDGVSVDEDCDDNDASIPAAPGTTCTDGNDNTENDVIAADGCTCEGTLIIDADEDGVRLEEDCDDNDPSIPATPGTACDDGDVNTENDVIAADGCSCGGIVIVDADNDGVRLEEDCDDNDPSIPATPGTACDDGDVNTENDVIAADGCSCGGNVIVDADGDGVRQEADCDDNDPSVPAAPGTACDDNSALTENDIIGADGCSCAGVVIPTCTVEGGEIAFLNGGTEETICSDDGIANPLDVNVFGPIGSNQQWIITDSESNILGLPMAPPFDLESVPAGTCLVWNLSFEDGLQGVEAGANLGDLDGCYDLSNSVSIVRLTGSDCPNFVVDADGDGVAADEDCDDNDASVPTTPGTSCDDANAGTENDVILADGCGCSGTPIPSCTVAGGELTFLNEGTEETICSDDAIANPLDVNLVGLIGSNQQWVITDSESNILGLPMAPPFDLEGVPAGTCLVWNLSFEDGLQGVEAGANLGDLDGCYDLSNPVSIVRLTGADCPNFVVDADGDGVAAAEDCDDNDASVPATPGTSCDDANADTENDVVTADGCGCEGTPVVTTGPDCANISIIAGNESFTVTGLDGAPVSSVQCFNSAWQEEYKCFGDCDATVTTPLAPGSYRIYAKYYTASYQLICSVEEVIEVTAGAPVDADGDGVIAAEDCDDNDASLPATPGTSCDDLNADTENDVILANGCDCAGTTIGTDPVDNDGDGVIAAEDCDDNDASVPATPGTSCDDANADTENDVVTADGCGCEGTPVVTTGPDCANISVVAGNGSFTVTGLDGAPVTSVQCFNSQWQEEFKCFGDCDASITETLAPGSYRVYVKYYTASYQLICQVEEVIEVTTGQPVDSDNDGVIASEDCDDNDASVPATPGTSCDDLNADTENDVVTADGCGCEGTPVSGCNIVVTYDNLVCDGQGTETINDDLFTVDVTVTGGNSDDEWTGMLGGQTLYGNYGETVEFGPFMTNSGSNISGWFMDALDSNCSFDIVVTAPVGCSSADVDNDNDGVIAAEDCDDNDASVPATPGTSCDDANADTENDVVTADGCGCEGTPVVTTGPDCADISITTGNGSFTVTGLDGAPVTSVQCFNSAWQEEYKCFGDCDATVTTSVTPGSYRVYVKYYTASYQLICTVEEVIEVTGTTQVVDNDNDGVPASEDCDDNDSSVPAAPGTSCDDNNPATNNDVLLANGCDCEGTLFVDNDGDNVPASEDCDDNNPAIPAAPGTTCNDNNANTVNDVILADGCDCAGEEAPVEVCTTRTASNVVKCDTGVSYGGWLKISGEANRYDISDSELVEFTDGTALYTATWTNKEDASLVFDLELSATGKTNSVPGNTPKEHNCAEVDTDAFYFYSDFEGMLSGRESAEGAEITISTHGSALQLGIGASATGEADAFGMSAWYTGEVLQQPTTGRVLDFNLSNEGHLGDININLSGDVDDCDAAQQFAISANASFLHLSATKLGSTVGLDWTSNNDYRTAINIIERSENGTEWMTIEETESLTRSTNATFYQTKDEQPAFGVNQYRIKQIMNDGTFIYSNVVDASFDVDPAKVVVYPNPTVEELNISLVEYAGNQGTLRIANALGQKMHEVSFDEIPAAPVHIELDQAYQAGTYTITVTIENRKPVTKFFIVSKL